MTLNKNFTVIWKHFLGSLKLHGSKIKFNIDFNITPKWFACRFYGERKDIQGNSE
jgi:hypothetical protein